MPACPLPANTYTSAHLFQETRHASVPGWQRGLHKFPLKLMWAQILFHSWILISSWIPVHPWGIWPSRQRRSKCDKAPFQEKGWSGSGGHNHFCILFQIIKFSQIIPLLQMQRNESVVRAMTPKAPMTNSSSSLEVSLLETKVCSLLSGREMYL